MATSSTQKKSKSGFNFELVSPAKMEVRGVEEKVTLPGEEGDLMILPGHTRLITNLRYGVISVVRGDQDAHRFYITGGFADIGPDHCTVLATQAMPVHMLNKTELEERLEILRGDLPETSEDKLPLVKNEIEEIKRKLSVLEEIELTV